MRSLKSDEAEGFEKNRLCKFYSTSNGWPNKLWKNANEKSVNLSEITIFRRHAFIFKLILPI